MRHCALPATLVGSHSQPGWLIGRARLGRRSLVRVRAQDLWQVAPECLEEAQNDATVLVPHDQDRAGIDIVTDGEMRRESYSNRFANALDGIDVDRLIVAPDGGLKYLTREVAFAKLGSMVRGRDLVRAEPG